jgi:poly(A) polymerase
MGKARRDNIQAIFTFYLKPGLGKRYLVRIETIDRLAEAGFSSYLAGPSALERYFGHAPGAVLWVETEGSLVDLSRLFDGLKYPGAEYFDAALEDGDTLVLFRCIDQPAGCGGMPQEFLQASFRYDIRRKSFLDPCDAYRSLRAARIEALPEEGRAGGVSYADFPKGLRGWYRAAEAALLISRFDYELPETMRTKFSKTYVEPKAGQVEARLSAAEQRFLLSGVATGKNAAAGMQLLMDSGFIDAHWPLLAEMDAVHHSKEHHPEGDVWKHSLETFSYRKVHELPLALGLLLHDCGKPFAQERNGNRFDQHAQIGAHKAERFLTELGFPDRVIGAVDFLVRYHMVPGAIAKLPVYRTEKVMSSPLFPELLELYRCDVSSTFRGPDGYYQACRTYRSFLKHSKNPFRSSDGKKRLRLLVE